MRTYLLFLLLFSMQTITALETKSQTDDPVSIIPKPARIINSSETFRIEKNTKILLLGEVENREILSVYLADQIHQLTGLSLSKQMSEDTLQVNTISFKQVADKNWGDEEYALLIDKKSIRIEAKTGRGFFYGIQSLLQMISIDSEVKVPCVKILDEPHYQYRGMHLDVCRHFFSVDFIKKYIDLMAMYKMNTFHWHLTEDQGWRIEIRKYPKLTETGAWRTEKDGSRYGGFYTQEQIKEIVAYASDRFITVIPEIELPGHSVAALAAYPELACNEGPFVVENNWGVFDDVYCAGKESTFEFLQNVMLEVIELFPSKYIHIGGDECPKASWKKCSLCQKRIKEEGLKDEHELQSYFIQRMEKFLLTKGRKIIGWDEILEGGLAPEATVMSWRGTQGGIEAAKQHHDVIMTPGTHCYFDHYQDDNYLEPTAIGGYTSLEKVYSFNPTPEELDLDEAKHILGAQGNVWSEYMSTSDYVEYMVVPRICALSEVLWTPIEQKDWNDFEIRMDHHYSLLKQKEINFFVPKPRGGVNKNYFFDKMDLPLEVAIPNSEIRFTLDGSVPDQSSNLYTEPISITESTTIKARTFLKVGGSSQIRNIECIKIEPLKPVSELNLSEGLEYKIYEGNFHSAKELNYENLIEKGTVRELNFPEGSTSKECIIEIKGYLKIEKDATYTFYNYSVDGALFYISDVPVIENDGINSRHERRGRIFLTKGIYPVKLVLLKKTPSVYQKMSWSCKDFDQSPINSSLLYH